VSCMDAWVICYVLGHVVLGLFVFYLEWEIRGEGDQCGLLTAFSHLRQVLRAGPGFSPSAPSTYRRSQMPKIVLVIVDQFHENSIVFFDDGMIAFAEEKCWLVLGGDGTIVERWWKEEPQSSSYYKAYCEYDSAVVEIPEWPDRDTMSPFSSLVFVATRKATEWVSVLT
jgi:hypothetical protein